MQLYAITDRRLLSAPNHLQGRNLLSLAEDWTAGGVDFIQLREKDLAPSQLQSLAREVTAKSHLTGTKLLVNVSTPQAASLAREAGADGVHIAGSPTPGSVRIVREIFPKAIVSLPCHSLEEVERAVHEQANLILFSPVFEKLGGSRPQGLEALHHACIAAQGLPVFALGGLTCANALECVDAGATGVAGIRIFASGDWRLLRKPGPGNDI
jgi:thiamine-phosphate pyrophosphorylase